MIIEIHGAGFKNKGAELMLRTTVSQLKARLPDFIPTIDPTYGTYESRCELGLRQTFPLRSHVGTPGFSQRFFKQKLFAKLRTEKWFASLADIRLSDYGCTSLNSVQALIDISGFAYTDQWGSQPTVDFARLTKHYKLLNKPVILLPQALGPFHEEKTRAAFRKVIDNSSLIFPRDQISYQHVMELCPNANHVIKAPDITLFYADSFNNKKVASVVSDYICLVPNCRMLAQGKKQWGEKYESYLIQIAKAIIAQNLKVYLVIHDSSGTDLLIAQSIFDKIDSTSVTLVTESNPIVLKEIIAESRMLIGSRYHSLVASFSNKIPALALGWSHKYEMLFKDFGCEQFLISHDTSIETILELVQKLIDKETNLFLRNQISERLKEMYQDNQKMWDIVENFLIKNIN